MSKVRSSLAAGILISTAGVLISAGVQGTDTAIAQQKPANPTTTTVTTNQPAQQKPNATEMAPPGPNGEKINLTRAEFDERSQQFEEITDRIYNGEVKSKWGGTWIDYTNGMTLVINVASDDAVSQLKTQNLPSTVRVNRVPFSVEDLQSQRNQFRTDVGIAITRQYIGALKRNDHESATALAVTASDEGYIATLDIPNNKVKFKVHDTPAMRQVIEEVNTLSSKAQPTDNPSNKSAVEVEYSDQPVEAVES